MRKNVWKKRILYGLIAVLLFVLLVVFTFHDRTHRLVRQQVRIVAFGDSVFGLPWDGDTIVYHLEQLLGEPVFNAAFGGTCVSRMDSEYPSDYSKDAISLVALTKALETEDFGVQQTMHFRESNSQNYADKIDGLETLDFSGVELVLIQHGLNDFYNGVPLDNEKDLYDEHTFKGALRSSIRSLRRANPNLRIVLMTQTYTWYRQGKITCEEYDLGYGNQEAYVQAEKEIAEELGLEFLDLYHDLYTHDSWDDWELYSADGLHPNEAGRIMLAEIIAEYLNSHAHTSDIMNESMGVLGD